MSVCVVVKRKMTFRQLKRTADSFLCKQCTNQYARHTEEMVAAAQERYLTQMSLFTEPQYTNLELIYDAEKSSAEKYMVKYKHEQCGIVSTSRAYDFLHRGTRCPACNGLGGFSNQGALVASQTETAMRVLPAQHPHGGLRLPSN